MGQRGHNRSPQRGETALTLLDLAPEVSCIVHICRAGTPKTGSISRLPRWLPIAIKNIKRKSSSPVKKRQVEKGFMGLKIRRSPFDQHVDGVEIKAELGQMRMILSRLGLGSPSWWNQSWFYNPF